LIANFFYLRKSRLDSHLHEAKMDDGIMYEPLLLLDNKVHVYKP